tara:strand:+ start:1045 stop:1497 length:453 start_codon:yes stop_codon:yes gene_type:complete
LIKGLGIRGNEKFYVNKLFDNSHQKHKYLIDIYKIKYLFCSKFVKPSIEHKMIGEHIRMLRERQNMLLRELAASLNMDAAMLSKMERGLRPFRKEDIEQLSLVLDENKENLHTMWLADRVLRATENDKFQARALKLALSKCQNKNLNHPS